jgi:hypothetical protein
MCSSSLPKVRARGACLGLLLVRCRDCVCLVLHSAREQACIRCSGKTCSLANFHSFIHRIGRGLEALLGTPAQNRRQILKSTIDESTSRKRQNHQIIDSKTIGGYALLTWRQPGGSPPLCAPAAVVVGNCCGQGAANVTDRLLWVDAGRRVYWTLIAEYDADVGRRQWSFLDQCCSHLGCQRVTFQLIGSMMRMTMIARQLVSVRTGTEHELGIEEVREMGAEDALPGQSRPRCARHGQ